MKRIPRIIAAFGTNSGWGRNLMGGVSAFAMQHGRWHCSFTNEGPSEGMLQFAESVDGLLTVVPDERMAEALSHVTVPVVVIGNYNPLKLPNVQLDIQANAQAAAQHLVDQGFRRCAYYAHHGTPNSTQMGKYFVEALAALGRECEWFQTEEVRGRAWSVDRMHLQDWVKKVKKPVAVFSVGDSVARLVALACRDARIRVPGQVAILGNNNDELVCKMCQPHISSIETNSAKVGFEAARLLQRILDGRSVPKEPLKILPGRVVPRESTEMVAPSDPKVSAALKYMREHLADGINVKEVARQLGVSRPTLTAKFHAQFGRTVHAEIVRMQLQTMCRLLEDGDEPLGQVAASCGIQYATRLGNFFRKHMGMTPMEYRRRHQRKAF